MPRACGNGMHVVFVSSLPMLIICQLKEAMDEGEDENDSVDEL